MLNAYQAPVFSYDDRVLFDQLVPYDHWTRRADARVDFLALRKSFEHHFSDEGRPAVEPVRCLKLELLMFHDGLSDRQVFAKAKTDIAYRMFLGLGRNEHLRDILEWATKLPLPEEADSNTTWQTLQKTIEIAQKALNGHDEPQASGKLHSIVDSDARREQKGAYQGTLANKMRTRGHCTFKQ